MCLSYLLSAPSASASALLCSARLRTALLCFNLRPFCLIDCTFSCFSFSFIDSHLMLVLWCLCGSALPPLLCCAPKRNSSLRGGFPLSLSVDSVVPDFFPLRFIVLLFLSLLFALSNYLNPFARATATQEYNSAFLPPQRVRPAQRRGSTILVLSVSSLTAALHRFACLPLLCVFSIARFVSLLPFPFLSFPFRPVCSLRFCAFSDVCDDLCSPSPFTGVFLSFFFPSLAAPASNYLHFRRFSRPIYWRASAFARFCFLRWRAAVCEVRAMFCRVLTLAPVNPSTHRTASSRSAFSSVRLLLPSSSSSSSSPRFLCTALAIPFPDTLLFSYAPSHSRLTCVGVELW